MRPVQVSRESGCYEKTKSETVFFFLVLDKLPRRRRRSFASCSPPRSPPPSSLQILRPGHRRLRRLPGLQPGPGIRRARLGLRPLLGLPPRRRQRPLREGAGLLAERERERRRSSGDGPRLLLLWSSRGRSELPAEEGRRSGGLVGAEADQRDRRQECRRPQPTRPRERQRRVAPDGRGETGRSFRFRAFFERRCKVFVVFVVSVSVAPRC